MRARRYDGEVALITGGASGIGRAIGSLLAERGARVVLADRQADAAAKVAAELVDAGLKAEAMALDVRDAKAFQTLAADVVSRHGAIDLFFNNAGIAVGGGMEDYQLEDWTDVLDVNSRGVAHGIQAVYPTMVAQRSGHIINTASMAGLLPMANEGSYGMAKHAVVGVSRSLRIEGKRFGVKVSALCPGAIRTPILTGGKFGRIKLDVSRENLLKIWEMVRPMDVDAFAVDVLRAVAENEGIIIVPSWWKALWLFDRVAPSWSEWLWGKIDDKGREKIEQFARERETPQPAR
jgi:NAD(P)-dependent dehydrogenase (short-subunit alcohol dehydrogenase family)